MKRLLIVCFALMILTVFSAGDLISAEKIKAAPRSMIQTFAGKVTNVDAAKKTITITALMETEYYLQEKDTVMKEFEVDAKNVTFDVSSAKFQGVKDINGITKSQLIRVGYDMKGNAYIAHTVLLVPRRQSRSSIRTFLGKVTAIDPAKKTMTVRATMEGEFFLHEKDTVLKERLIDEADITFNTSDAVIVGNKTIKPGDTVRVGYDKKDNAYAAHTVLKIEKK